MTIEWYSAKSLEGTKGLPSHATNITRKALNEGWIKRSTMGVKGGGYEFHYSSFPIEVQKELGFVNATTRVLETEQTILETKSKEINPSQTVSNHIKEWFTANELVSQKGLPNTEQGINRQARTKGWLKRKIEGVRGGRALEYHYSSLPPIVQEALGFEPVEPTHEPIQAPFATVVTEKKDMVTVPQFDLTASAGNGSYVVAESPVAEFTFSHDWIIEQGLHNKKLTVVPVRGDSMEDKLHDGDLLIVSIVEDMREAREGICVVRYVDEIFVKRVHFDWKSRGYKIISDNEAYDDMFIDEEDIISGRFQVVGKMEFKLQRTKNA